MSSPSKSTSTSRAHEKESRAGKVAGGNGGEEGGNKPCNAEPLLTSIQYSNGAIFRGQVSGYTESGAFDWFSGMQYIGQYRNDRRNGFGELVWPDGSKYEGGFKDDLREGKGKHYWDSGEVYEGEYHKDKRHGNGCYTWPSGASFTGSFFRDLKEGPGKFISAKGEIFEGMYHDDLRDGEGTLSYIDGTQDSGIWKGRKLVQLNFAAHGVTFDPYSVHVSGVPKKKYKPATGRLERLSEEFIMFAANNDLRKVQQIVDAEVAHVDVKDANLFSPFFVAAINGHCDIVEFLLDYGLYVDVNQQEIHGVTALNACIHVLFSGHPEVARTLFKTKRASRPSPESDDMPVTKDCELRSCFSNTVVYPSSPEATKKPAEPDLDNLSAKPVSNSLFKSVSLGPIIQKQDRLNPVNRLATPPKLSPLIQRSCTVPNLKKAKSTFESAESENNSELMELQYSMAPHKMKGRVFNPLLKRHTVSQCDFSPTGWVSKPGGSSGFIATASAADGEILGLTEDSEVISSSVDKDADRYKISVSDGARLSVTSDSSGMSSMQQSEDVSMVSLLQNAGNENIEDTTNEDAEVLRKESSSLNLPSLKKYQPRLGVGLDALNPFSSSKFGSVNSAAKSTSICSAISSSDESSASSSTSSLNSPASPKYISDEKLRKMIDLLLKRGADPTLSSKHIPPLVYTVLAGDKELSAKLLEKGADPHYVLPPELGEYPLIHLVSKRLTKTSPALIELLLCHDVDPNLEYDVVSKKPTQGNSCKVSMDEKKTLEKRADAMEKAITGEKFSHSEKSGSLEKVISVKKIGIVPKASSSQKTACARKVSTSTVKNTKQSSSSMAVRCSEKTQKLDSGKGVGSKKATTETAMTGLGKGESQEKTHSSHKTMLGSVKSMGVQQKKYPDDKLIKYNSASKAVVSSERVVRKSLQGSINDTSSPDSVTKPPELMQKAGKLNNPVRSTVESKSVQKVQSPEKAIRNDPTSGATAERQQEESSVQVEDLEETKIAGENEGSTALTPIHFVCGTKLHGTADERKKLYDIIPTAMQILFDHGADLDRVFLGHSPLSMAILSGHDNAIKMLLENGAAADVPLGPGIGNALCVLTTHVAHRVRLPSLKGEAPEIPFTNPVHLAHNLLLMGASLVAPVRFAKDSVGIVMDFAHAAFKTERRLSLVKYSSLSKSERMQYRSVKKLQKHLLNLLRCRALITVGKDENFLKQISNVEEHLDYVNDIVTKLRILRLPAHSKEKKQALKKAQTCPEMMVLPELTLKHSLDGILQALSGDKMDDEDYEHEARVETPPKKSKTSSVANKIVRYKELIKNAESIFKYYTGSLSGRKWSFSDFCYECGKTAGVRLTLCTGCEVVSYCSRVCKMENWKKGHREECCKVDMIKMRMLS